jgi:hypothetical protein
MNPGFVAVHIGQIIWYWALASLCSEAMYAANELWWVSKPATVSSVAIPIMLHCLNNLISMDDF